MDIRKQMVQKKVESEYKAAIPQTVAEIKKRVIIDLSTEIQLIKATAQDSINRLVSHSFQELGRKIAEVEVAHGPEGQRGIPGARGIQGIPGADGVAGQPGKDGKQGKEGKPGKNGSPDTPDQIIEKINKSTALIDSSRIKGANTLPTGRRKNTHGGGDTVLAGANITITTNLDGTKTLAASAGFSKLAPTGTVDGVNQTFVFTSAPSLIVVDQGRTMQKISSDGTVNWTGTTTILLSIAPNFDIYGL